MDLVKSILDYLKKKNTDDAIAAPKAICPNCWGREEYGGHFYERVEQENLKSKSSESNLGWINGYANKHLFGIALKRKGLGEDLVCDECETSYTHSDEHTSS